MKGEPPTAELLTGRVVEFPPRLQPEKAHPGTNTSVTPKEDGWLFWSTRVVPDAFFRYGV